MCAGVQQCTHGRTCWVAAIAASQQPSPGRACLTAAWLRLPTRARCGRTPGARALLPTARAQCGLASRRALQAPQHIAGGTRLHPHLPTAARANDLIKPSISYLRVRCATTTINSLKVSHISETNNCHILVLSEEPGSQALVEWLLDGYQAQRDSLL